MPGIYSDSHRHQSEFSALAITYHRSSSRKCVILHGRADFYFFFFFQAEDGIRDWSVTGVHVCSSDLPVTVFVPVLRQTRAAPALVRFRSNDLPAAHRSPSYSATALSATAGFPSTGRPSVWRVLPDRKSVVSGKGVDLGGRRIIKKKMK